MSPAGQMSSSRMDAAKEPFVTSLKRRRPISLRRCTLKFSAYMYIAWADFIVSEFFSIYEYISVKVVFNDVFVGFEGGGST